MRLEVVWANVADEAGQHDQHQRGDGKVRHDDEHNVHGGFLGPASAEDGKLASGKTLIVVRERDVEAGCLLGAPPIQHAQVRSLR
jgi:hypothetical protein